MNKLIFIFTLLILSACNKPKVVLICGDHICVNKSEAEQFFEENLSLEVKLIDKNRKNEVDLVELNLSSDLEQKKKINIFKKKETKRDLKVLTNEEIKKKKTIIKEKKRLKEKKLELVKKNKKKIKKKNKVVKKKKISSLKNKKVIKSKEKDIVDICLILDNCDINEISKYLINEGKNRSFPDITVRN